MDRKCATCLHWAPRSAGAMAKNRMAPCALGKPWTYYGPDHKCERHSMASPEVIEGRQIWLTRGTKTKEGSK